MSQQFKTIIVFAIHGKKVDYPYADAILEPEAKLVWAILAKQDEQDRKGKAKPLLIVMDDLIGSGWQPKTKHKGLFDYLMTTSRHIGISTLFSVQYPFAMSPLMRENASAVVISTRHVSPEQVRHLGETLPIGKAKLAKSLEGLDKVGKLLLVEVGPGEPEIIKVPGRYATVG